MVKNGYFLVACCIFLFSWNSVFSQRSDLTRKNNKVKNYSTHKFKKNKKFAEICPIFHVSEYPYQGIGLKIGDPLALTYKFYATTKWAFGIDVGKASEGLYSQLHKKRFESVAVPADTSYFYVSHEVLNQNVFSAKLFYYKEGPRTIKGLDFYVGLGYQMQFADIKYDYIAVSELPPETRETKQVTLSFQPKGVEAMGGLEYAYFDLPVTVFAELGIFFGTDNVQQWQKFQGGMGIRYVF